jgi:hypothetical protein
MKGPYERLKYDLRRLWECPVCKRRERTASSIVFRHCACQVKQPDDQPVVMKLILDSIQRVGPPITIRHEPLETMPVGEASPTVSEPLPQDAPTVPLEIDPKAEL